MRCLETNGQRVESRAKKPTAAAHSSTEPLPGRGGYRANRAVVADGLKAHWALNLLCGKIGKPGEIGWRIGSIQSVAGNEPILCLARITCLSSKNQAMNDYQVTFANGDVVEVEAWTPEIAGAIAEEEADLDGQSVVTVELLAVQRTEG